MFPPVRPFYLEASRHSCAFFCPPFAIANGNGQMRSNEVAARGERADAALLLIRRNLDQAAVGVAAIDREQGAARALLFGRAFLDFHAMRVEMRDHLIRRARGEET